MPSVQSFILKKGIKIGVKRLKKGRDIKESRKMLDSAAKKWIRIPVNCEVKSINIDGIYAEWLSTNQCKDDKVILYFHGGGYCYCSPDTHRALAARIMLESGVKVLLPKYRLAPEYPFPAAIDDAICIYKWLLTEGYKSSNIIFAGDSAGGGLSVAATLVLREQYEKLPAAVVCLSPWVDLTSSGESYHYNVENDPYLNNEGVRKTALLYAGNESLEHPLVSPVFADYREFPPLFIQVGSIEILLSDAKMLAEKARMAGGKVEIKVWDGMWHVWQVSKRLPEAKQAIKEIGKFVNEIFSS